MKFPWQKPNHKDQLIETYRQALIQPTQTQRIGAMERCYGHLKPRRWKGGGDGADLAIQALQQTENSAALKLTKEE